MKSYIISNREMEIIKFLVKGYNNTEIAKELYLSKYTVKAHLSNIMNKMNAKNRTNLAYMLGNSNNINLDN